MLRYAQSFLFLHLSILTMAGLAGCSVAHDAASATYYAASTTYHATSATYHVVTAPVRIIKRNVGRRPPPGRHVETTATTDAPTRKDQMIKPDSSITTLRAAPQRAASLRTATVSSKPKAAPAPVAAPPVQFPIAERVPGKSGLVMSPFDPEARYVDVSGYASGSKVKDPWTEKIFIVP